MSSNVTTPEPVVSGYINAKVEDEPPIFNKSKVGRIEICRIEHSI